MDDRFVIVAAEFNRTVSERLVAGAEAALKEAGVESQVVWVPGSWELPAAAQAAALSGAAAIVAVGAVIKGETDHYTYIAAETTRGLMDVMLGTGVPIGMGVLTVHTAEAAMDRSTPGPGNKGHEASRAALRLLSLLRDLETEFS